MKFFTLIFPTNINFGKKWFLKFCFSIVTFILIKIYIYKRYINKDIYL